MWYKERASLLCVSGNACPAYSGSQTSFDIEYTRISSETIARVLGLAGASSTGWGESWFERHPPPGPGERAPASREWKWFCNYRKPSQSNTKGWSSTAVLPLSMLPSTR
mmetsp:Transcript_26328/g.41640  ORF Transcript_26328/g.41640 Transcript_26328/m.41640 type:complete len:109 (+) Transcript_26328:1153-1479(+)